MENILSQEERIRRAEELYAKRKVQLNHTYAISAKSRREHENQKVKKGKLTKKAIIQVAVCFGIYSLFYGMKQSDDVFLQEMRGKIYELLNQEINLEQWYQTAEDFFANDQKWKQLLLWYHKDDEISHVTLEKNENNDAEENINELKQETNELVSENLEPPDEENIEQQNNVNDDEQAIIQTEEEYIKQTYHIIWPVQGTITSRFGTRTPTDIVTAEHFGLDIGAAIGTPIVAAMDGVVTVSSSYGEYGNHVRIEDGSLKTLYAHCNQLFVSEGANVKKGDIIAEVGETR